MLYIPAMPIQFIEKNPPRYQSPAVRGLQHEEIWLKTKDGLKLQGWFMYQEKDTKKAITLIFLHENAGNIGLRLDWFELMYKNLNCNILAVAYRGYSRSQGSPD